MPTWLSRTVPRCLVNVILHASVTVCWIRLTSEVTGWEKQKVNVKSLSCVRLLATPWTVAYQAPPSMGWARVLERVAISFSGGSSWPRDRARVSRIVGRRFTVWVTWEVREKQMALSNAAGPCPVSWRPEQNTRAALPLRRRELLLPDCLELGLQFSFVFLTLNLNWKHWLPLGLEPAGIHWHRTISSPSPQASRLRLEPHHQLSWLPGLSTADPGDLPASTSVWANSLACGCVPINTHTYTYPIGSISLENPASHNIAWRVSNKDHISPLTKITKLLCWIMMTVSFQVNITFLQLYILIMKTQCHVRNSLGFNRYFLHGNVTNFSKARANHIFMAWKKSYQKDRKMQPTAIHFNRKDHVPFFSLKQENVLFLLLLFS